MVSIVDQILGLTGKVLGSLLDWPFLLFVLIVWIVARYRNQIGSMLDRRGMIKRSDLFGEVRQATDPIASEVSMLRPQISKLRSEMDKLSAGQADLCCSGDLERVTARTAALETAVRRVQAGLDNLSGIDLQEQLQPGFEKIRRVETQVQQAASSESPDTLRNELAELHDGLRDLALTVGLLRSEVQGMQRPGPNVTAVSAARGDATAVDTDADAFEVMRRALSSTRWPWRRVRKLAEMAGVSEEQAHVILERRTDVRLRKDDWGRMIAKLADK